MENIRPRNEIRALCPRCGGSYSGYPALSRRDNKSKICSDCGNEEAIFDLKMHLWDDEKEKKELIIKEKKWLEMSKKSEVIIWEGFKWTMEEGETVDDVIDKLNDGAITSYANHFIKITDLNGIVLKEINI